MELDPEGALLPLDPKWHWEQAVDRLWQELQFKLLFP